MSTPVFRSDARWKSRWMALSGVLAILSTTILLLGAAALPHRQREASRLVGKTLEVQDAAHALEINVERIVKEERGYLIVGDPARKADVDAVARQIDRDLQALRTLTAGDAEQQVAVDHLDSLIRSRIALLRTNMALFEAGDHAKLRDVLGRHVSRDIAGNIRAVFTAIQAEERRLLPLRRQAAEWATSLTAGVMVVCGIIAAVSTLTLATLVIVHRREQRHLSERQRTDALLRTIIQTTPGLVYAKDVQGRMILANQAVLEMVGKPFSALEGLTDREFLDDPDEGKAVMANDRLVLAEGKTLVVEELVRGDSPAPRTWLSTKTPMRDSSGAIIGMVGMSVDITDRKRAEQRLLAFNAELEGSVAARTADLAASEARQRVYFSCSPIGLVAMRVRDNRDPVVEAVNPAAEEAFGFPASSGPGLTPMDLWPDIMARETQVKMRDCASRCEVIRYSTASDTGDGPRQLDVVMAPLPVDGVDGRAVLMCVQDVTEQRALEQQVVEQAARVAEAAERETALFRNSPDELFVIRVEGEQGSETFVYEAFSPSLETITGFKPDDLVGRKPEDCFDPADAHTLITLYRRCLSGEDTIRFSMTRALPVGQRDLEGSISPVHHAGTGRIVRLIGVARDVTERNRMEAARRQGQKLEAIGQVAAGVAHDFNNILQVIMGGLELVMHGLGPTGRGRDFAKLAFGAAERGSQLTHHLLSYARKQMLRPQPVELDTFLDNLRTLLAESLGPQTAIDLRMQGAPQALVDAGQLQTALLNLAFNAAGAMPDGGTLGITAYEHDVAGTAWVRIDINDTGIGMDQATLARATEPFFTTKGVGGTGLGLSMVQGFVEQSGGTLRIASTLGEGTSVQMILPAAPRGTPCQPEEEREEPEPQITARVLLVDDSTDVLATVGAFLAESGIEVVRVDNSVSAPAILADRGPFDVLVTDYAMPGSNGADLIAECRVFQPDLKALIITGYAGLEDMDEGLEGTEILYKPFQRRQLTDVMLRVLAKTPAPVS